MNCFNNCCQFFHKSTALTETDGNLVVTVTNPTNIASEDRFCFVLCQKPSSVVTGDPIPVTMTINGANVPVFNKFSVQMNSRELERYYRCGKLMKGYFVTNADQSYVIFNEIPKCKCNS